MLIIFESDFTVTDSGFACSWTSVIAPSVAPNAAFSMGTTTPPLNIDVQFNDQSTGGPTSWLWYFGDGDTAKTQNPLHAYASPGMYTVTLIAFTCNESDTITHNLTVQGSPNIVVSPLTGFSASVQCGDSSNFNLNISNTGGGELVYDLAGSIVGTIKVLAMKYGTNQFREYLRTLAAINSTFTNYTLTETTDFDPGIISGLLVGKNVLLIPEQETSANVNAWTNLAPVIKQYLNNGGSVIFCGSSSSLADNLFNTGIFTGSYIGNVENTVLTISNTTHPLLNGVTGTSMNAPSSTFAMNLTNPDVVTLVNAAGNDVVSYRYYGTGKAIFIGFDYYQTTTQASKIIANAIEWGGENALPQWIDLTKTRDTVAGGGSSPVGVTFTATGLPAGTYYANIGVNSNDPNNATITVPCTLTVSGLPIINLSEDSLIYSNIMQFSTVFDTFTVINNGCDTLFVNNFLPTNSSFVVTPTFSYLLPGAFADVVVQFSSSTLGVFDDTLNIINNDNDTLIFLHANVIPSPVISPSSASVTAPIRACEDTASTILYIRNNGATGSLLDYNIGSLPSWVTASPVSGTVNSADSAAITLTYYSGTFSAGPQNTNISIVSNDPVAPNKIVPFIMAVDTNPCVDFTVVPNTCTGVDAFTSTSINTPTSYAWDFGDGGTATTPNPTHGFPNNGQFTVTLIACNHDGCDTVVMQHTATITGPVATNCHPQTTAFCNCGIGITKFAVISGPDTLINNISNDAVDGFVDYTCTDTATLTANTPYTFYFETGFVYAEAISAYIDLDNNGSLDSTWEEIYLDPGSLTFHTGTVTIPDYPTNVYGAPLRMRILTEYNGNFIPGPCRDLQFGQAEDYSIFLSMFTGVKEPEAIAGFNVYPNPFSNSATIDYRLNANSLVTLEVYDVMGKNVKTFAASEMQQGGKHSYNFSEQSGGIYFVKLAVDGKSSVKKIIKM
jgi:PKD repeat protein